MKFNKSLITNLIALILILIGYLITEYKDIITTIGYFALSGSITNWLAIHMLFEKVPLCYGSGVIPNKFEEFKLSIRKLIIEQFFTQENIKSAIGSDTVQKIELSAIADCIDYDKLFDSLVNGILESPLGSMLNMFGGKSALTSLREPVIEKLKITLHELAEDKDIKEKLSQNIFGANFSEQLVSKVETIVDKRLEELTPKMVKQMVEEIIHEHLGWLVVWGGVFGGILGAIKAISV